MTFGCKSTNPIVIFRIRGKFIAKMNDCLNGVLDFTQLPDGMGEMQ
ncbi:Uncharacterised protein [Burkholderia cepacia]|uniref:Uncharacterized protein n=1 Tax=Burkholderia cepacia TaxID=292 RepID=A0AAE8T5W6_BURCE|nr:hypothetical protein CSX04_00821 [Burkholderia cepacia]SQA56957.1 Uncharacterised protein [Burkholderia cepacia]